MSEAKFENTVVLVCHGGTAMKEYIRFLSSDFVTPLKKRRMARASMCAELPSFTSAPTTPVPESPLVVEHRSASVGGESSNPEQTDFTIPLLDAASLQPPEGDVPSRLPNGLRPPSHHFSCTSAGSSTDNLFQVYIKYGHESTP